MKTTVTQPVKTEASKVAVTLPVVNGTQDIPDDFPLRRGGIWKAVIDIDTGRIEDWPEGVGKRCLFLKVGEDGIYTLREPDGTTAARIIGPVPLGIMPGEDDAYVDLVIEADGTIQQILTDRAMRRGYLLPG